jgi:hypothetical protein
MKNPGHTLSYSVKHPARGNDNFTMWQGRELRDFSPTPWKCFQSINAISNSFNQNLGCIRILQCDVSANVSKLL